MAHRLAHEHKHSCDWAHSKRSRKPLSVVRRIEGSNPSPSVSAGKKSIQAVSRWLGEVRASILLTGVGNVVNKPRCLFRQPVRLGHRDRRVQLVAAAELHDEFLPPCSELGNGEAGRFERLLTVRREHLIHERLGCLPVLTRRYHGDLVLDRRWRRLSRSSSSCFRSPRSSCAFLPGSSSPSSQATWHSTPSSSR